MLWQHRGVKEVTWEREDTVRTNYPFLFEGGENCETQEKHFFFFLSEYESIGNSCREGTDKTLDFSLDLR